MNSPYQSGNPTGQAARLVRQKSAFFRPAGSAVEGAFEVFITPENAGWSYSGLKVLKLGAGDSFAFHTGPDELIVLPLEGSCSVTVDGARFDLQGRENVFQRVSDFVYAPIDASVQLESTSGGRFAFPSARTSRKLVPKYGAAEDVVIEVRGAGHATRQVNNFCSPAAFPFADKPIAVEVLTPSGNWSSYPPHKHDEHRINTDGEVLETQLEEIYAFAVRGNELGIQRAYSSGPGREIDVFAEVGEGDVVLIPHGWHGPSVAPPHSDLYYLNVMAGPAAGRAWKICFDADRANAMSHWAQELPDPRVPMTSPLGRTK